LIEQLCHDIDALDEEKRMAFVNTRDERPIEPRALPSLSSRLALARARSGKLIDRVAALYYIDIQHFTPGPFIMSAVLTVRLNDAESSALDRLTRATGKSRSDLVRDALRAQAMRETMRLLQEDLGPQARASGWLTEEDILRDVS
jgi:predicted transcriptional regulator